MHTNNNAATKSEILAILDTYEGQLRLDWNNKVAKEQWTMWKARLAVAK